MPAAFSEEFAEKLCVWIQSSLDKSENILSGGYQGTTLLYDDGSIRLVIKTPPSSWRRFLLLPMLRHEYRIYNKLSAIEGVPHCYGLLKNRFLLLQYIEGCSLRDRPPEDHAPFFADFLSIIEQLHAAGIAHMDLKKKDNILIAGNKPYLIDFGVACMRKSGFSPFNHLLFEIAKNFDFNAWVKHKYGGHYAAVSEQDRVYLKQTVIERISRVIKKPYRRLRRKIKRRFMKKGG